jgi:hypothetical protein
VGPPTALCGRRSGGGGAARGAAVGARAPSVQEAAGEVWGVDESGPYLGRSLDKSKNMTSVWVTGWMPFFDISHLVWV